MKLIILLFVLSLPSYLFAKPIKHISCQSSQEDDYSLEVQVDILESAPPQSVIKLYINNNFYAEQNAYKELIYQEGKVPQIIYHFVFRDVEEKKIKFLRVYLTQRMASMIYINSYGSTTPIIFEHCNFSYERL